MKPDSIWQWAARAWQRLARNSEAPTDSVELSSGNGTAGGSVAVGGGVNVANGNVVFGNQYNFQADAFDGKPPSDDVHALQIYREFIAYNCGDIPLSGLDRSADDASARARSLELEKVYVDLDTERQVSDEAVKKALATGTALSTDDRMARERVEDLRPLSALEAVALHPRLVLLGGPGSGKTTFVNRLALALARNDWTDLERWPERLRGCLPIIVVLRDFARWLEPQKTSEPCAALLWRYLEHELERRKLEFALKLLDAAVSKGEALVFLDGLDEVPPSQRDAVLATVSDFEKCRPNTCMLITCRVASYEQPEWRLPEARFPEAPLAPFDQDKIKHFVSAWYDEMAARRKESRERTNELAARCAFRYDSVPGLDHGLVGFRVIVSLASGF